MLRLITPGHAAPAVPRDVLFLFYAHDDAAHAAAEHMPDACVLVDTQIARRADGSADGSRYTRLGSGGIDGILPLERSISEAQRLAGPFQPRRVFAAGFSTGGQAPTTWLKTGTLPDGIAIADGWHCSTVPGPMAERRAYVAEARAGRRVLVLSHTQIVPPTYTSTRRTAELLTGWDLHEAGPTSAPIRHEEEALLVESYEGADGAAHMRQLAIVLPLLVAQMAALADAFDTPRAWAAPAPIGGGSLGERALSLALAEYDRHEHELPGNTGPRVRLYLASCVRGGQLLKSGILIGGVRLRLDRQPYCSGALGWTDHLGARPGDVVPPWRAAVHERVEDARVLGVLHPIGDGYRPRRGDAVICSRGSGVGGDPMHGGLGHVGRVLEEPGPEGGFMTLDANHDIDGGELWSKVPRTLSDTNLRAFVSYAELAMRSR